MIKKILNQLNKELEANAKNKKLNESGTFLDGVVLFPIFMLLGYELIHSSFVYFYENYWYFSLLLMLFIWWVAYFALIRLKLNVTKDYYRGGVLLLSITLAFWTTTKALHYFSLVEKQEICFKAKVTSKRFSHKDHVGSVSFDSFMSHKINSVHGIGQFEYEEAKRNQYITVCGQISKIGFNHTDLRGYWKGEESIDNRFSFDYVKMLR